MATRSIIKTCIKAVKEKNPDNIKLTENLLTENITKASKEPIFYSLPFEQISNIIKQVDFLNPGKVKEPIEVLQTLIQTTSESHEKEAVLLLNDLKIDNLPLLSFGEIIGILSKFKNCELLTKLWELYDDDQHCLAPDYESEIKELKEELQQKNKEIEGFKKKIEELHEKQKEEKIKFPPITEKPKDFVENIFEACEKGKLDSIQYHFEVLHTDMEKTAKRILPGDSLGTRHLSLLHITAAYGYLPIVQYLCEVAKVNTEATDKWGKPPLHYACKFGHLPVAQYLCEVAKVNKEARDRNRYGALDHACWNGHLPVIQYLCEVAKVDAGASLLIACEKGQLSVVKYLCEVQKVDTEGALYIACEAGCLPIVKYLCEVQKISTKEAYSIEKFEPEIREYLESISVNE